MPLPNLDFWYGASILTTSILTRQATYYDFWAFEGGTFLGENLYFPDVLNGLRSAVSLSYVVFVISPLTAWLIGTEIRLFLWLQHFTGLKYWVQVAIFLPIFLVVEEVFAPRDQLMLNIQLFTANVIQGDLTVKMLEPTFVASNATVSGTITGNDYIFIWGPWYGIKSLWPDEEAPKEHVWVFQVQAWITALCWIFLIVPLALFVWFIYEPEFSMRWRRQLWQRWRDRKSKQEQV